MFGTFRLVLAMMVVWYHLIDRAFAGPIAVFGFFALSGYLMTRVMNETYADGVTGFARYLANRALRIYPAYLAVLGLVLAIVALWPAGAVHFSAAAFRPEHRLANVAILSLWPDTPAIISPAWSLNIELLHYIAIGALLGRSRVATVAWFVLSIEAPLIMSLMFDLQPDGYRFHPLSVSVAFAAGAMIWHFSGRLPRSTATIGLLSTIALAAAGLAMSRGIGNAGGLYAGLSASIIAIIALRDIPAPEWDRRLGDFAYPVFLLHFPAFKVVSAIPGISGGAAVGAALLATAAASWLLIALVDRPIEAIRRAIRKPRRPAAAE
ncbi:MAG TPA: acyltransferase [Dongiaceae bacterium]|nr:acyltransferase [Dongiaceae bacterium]